MSAPCTHEWTQEKYEVVSSRVCTLCNENEVEAQLATLTRERDAALARVKEIERDTTKAWNDHLKVCSEASAIAEIYSLENMVKHEHSERMRLDGLRADLVRERDELAPYRAEALLVRQQLDAMMVPTTVTKPDGSKVSLETWERVRLVLSQRDEAQANYRFMVERAADQKLDGYRELGARAAAAENERDKALVELKRMKERPAEAEYARLDTMWQQLVQERDQAMQLLREAHKELATIEAITVSPSDTDGLIDMVNRIGTFLENPRGVK